jgi:hypothetical protein
VAVGHTYANVHSTKFGGGEIRGQINDRDQKEYTGPAPFVGTTTMTTTTSRL